MQRPFVWNDERIYRLIDSLPRGFPVGAVMLWRTSGVQRFRHLPRNVLDGQQRLTSLFAAFKGTYNHKRLYIDVLSGSPEGKDPGKE
jgi:uncharacterized protein with ParB-like and HNH nuclease domain